MIGASKIVDLASEYTGTSSSTRHRMAVRESRSDRWLHTATKPPSRGIFSVPLTCWRETSLRNGMIAPREANR